MIEIKASNKVQMVAPGVYIGTSEQTPLSPRVIKELAASGIDEGVLMLTRQVQLGKMTIEEAGELLDRHLTSR